ncbi:MAG: molybdate ABC transporter permease subunit [Lachnospiraceae bacterium]|nr:molybdate ABC transporter permease subunit [Lachnospiraceae bacterium]
MNAILEMAAGFDWSPFWISLKTGIVATVICFFLGIFAARKVLRLGPKARAAVDGILTLPMVLAPTVAGFFLLLLFSLRRPLGAFLYGTFGIKVVQTWLGCIIAASVIAFPLMYRNARAAFEQIDIDLVYAARTLGMSDFKLFWKVVVPAAGPGIASGTVLTFARALGEYGATSMLAGNIAGVTGTISQRIAYVIKNGDYATGAVWVVIMLLIALGIIIAINLLAGGRSRRQNRW